MPDLPEFPRGIDTRLHEKKVTPFKPPRRKRPPDPRRTFLWIFALVMLAIFFTPLISDVAGRH